MSEPMRRHTRNVPASSPCRSPSGAPQPVGAAKVNTFVLSAPLPQSYHYPGRGSHPYVSRVHTGVREAATAVPGKNEPFSATLWHAQLPDISRVDLPSRWDPSYA